MADVFISYKSERRAAARHLASIIEAHGFSVWFDYELVPGKNFGLRIEEELRQAKAVVVLWCSMSVQSEWVQDEADLAKKLGRFLPARIEACDPPLGFRRDDYVDISDWDGDPSTRSLDRLIDRIEALVGRESMIARRTLVDMHTTWVTLRRPHLSQIALGQSRKIADEERRLPSSGRAAESVPAMTQPAVAASGAEAEWRALDLDACEDPGLLAAYAAKWQAADPVWAYKAGRAKSAIDSAAEQRQRQARDKAEAEARQRADQERKAQLQAAAEQLLHLGGAIKVAAATFHGDSEAARTGWLKPGAGKSEWFKDHDAGPEMVVVPAGSFMMGSPAGEVGRWSKEELQKFDWAGAEDQHAVNLTRSFAVGRHAITRGQFSAFVAATGHKPDGGAYVWKDRKAEHDPNASWRNPGFAQDDGHPVVCVSWEDAKTYTAWLSKQTGQAYRLLSEAEWEYVARAGTKAPFWFGDAITTDQANYNGNYVYGPRGVKGEFRRATVPAGSFAANPWGLFQVHGNVWEWCEDAWHQTYDGAPADGAPRTQGGDQSRRVVRGGSWGNGPQILRSASRDGNTPDSRYSSLGFRVGRTL